MCTLIGLCLIFLSLLKANLDRVSLLGGKENGQDLKWPDKSTTGYDMFDFKSYIKNL